jgi:hypothetical protein
LHASRSHDIYIHISVRRPACVVVLNVWAFVEMKKTTAGGAPLRASDAGVNLFFAALSGRSSAVERKLPKLDVAGSIPAARSIHSTT